MKLKKKKRVIEKKMIIIYFTNYYATKHTSSKTIRYLPVCDSRIGLRSNK